MATMTEVPNSDIPNKVQEYERFLNETLKQDLSKVLDQRDKLYSEIAEYLQLKTVIERIKESDLSTESLKTKVDIGCNFYVQANVPDASMIYVSVGYGFFVEFTHDEALRFIEKKTSILNNKVDLLTKDSAKIKAHIKLVVEVSPLEKVANVQTIEKLKVHQAVANVRSSINQKWLMLGSSENQKGLKKVAMP